VIDISIVPISVLIGRSTRSRKKYNDSYGIDGGKKDKIRE